MSPSPPSTKQVGLKTSTIAIISTTVTMLGVMTGVIEPAVDEPTFDDWLGAVGTWYVTVFIVLFAYRQRRRNEYARKFAAANAPAVVIGSSVDAERFVASWLRINGWPAAQVTPPTQDEGLDVVAPGLAVQVKRYTDSPIGRPTLQALWGARRSDADVAAVFTSSRFTAQAIEYAHRRGVALYVFHKNRGFPVRPLNELARNLIGQPNMRRF